MFDDCESIDNLVSMEAMESVVKEAMSEYRIPAERHEEMLSALPSIYECRS